MSDTRSAVEQTASGGQAANQFDKTLAGMSETDLRGLLEEILDRLPVDDMDSVIQAAQQKRQSKANEAREAFLRTIEEQAARLGFRVNVTTIHAAGSASGRKSRRDTGTPVAAKFRGPNGETWSGRGIPPKWLTALEAQGRTREEFRIS